MCFLDRIQAILDQTQTLFFFLAGDLNQAFSKLVRHSNKKREIQGASKETEQYNLYKYFPGHLEIIIPNDKRLTSFFLQTHTFKQLRQ